MPRGGKRKNAGRKKQFPTLKTVNISITEEQAKLLRMWGRGCLSAGLRWLIEAAKPLIVKIGDSDIESQVVSDHLHNSE